MNISAKVTVERVLNVRFDGTEGLLRGALAAAR